MNITTTLRTVALLALTVSTTAAQAPSSGQTEIRWVFSEKPLPPKAAPPAVPDKPIATPAPTLKIRGLVPGRPAKPAATPAPAPRRRSHKVKPGETLSSIARQHGATTKQLAAANRLKNPDRIKVGQELVVPANPATQK